VVGLPAWYARLVGAAAHVQYVPVLPEQA